MLCTSLRHRNASRSSSATIVASSTVRDCALQWVSVSVPWSEAVRQGVNVTVGASNCVTDSVVAVGATFKRRGVCWDM